MPLSVSVPTAHPFRTLCFRRRNSSTGRHCTNLTEHRDDFGTVWQVERLGICGIPVEWPIADLDRYDAYQWPADFAAGPPAGRQYNGHICGFDDRWYARGAGGITYFEQLQQLRGKVAFRTNIDRQHVMPFGSPAQVKEEVHRTFEACGTARRRPDRLWRSGPGRVPGEHSGHV